MGEQAMIPHADTDAAGEVVQSQRDDNAGPREERGYHGRTGAKMDHGQPDAGFDRASNLRPGRCAHEPDQISRADIATVRYLGDEKNG